VKHRLIIAGSRTIEVHDRNIEDAIRAGFGPDFEIAIVICGMAQGPDLAGRRWARSRGIQVADVPADWQRYGNRAGPERNARMARQATALLAFWDGVSDGTRDMIQQAYARQLLVHVTGAPVNEDV
jgi:hypothetical protein